VATPGGTLVLAADAGGRSEIVVDGVTGVTVPPNDPEAPARAMVHLVDNPAPAGTNGFSDGHFEHFLPPLPGNERWRDGRNRDLQMIFERRCADGRASCHHRRTCSGRVRHELGR
jgi:glycosyltransferase involved in cell wall biosynthesis